MDMYAQTTSTSGALVNYLSIINQGGKISENCRVLKIFLAGSKGLILGKCCVTIVYVILVGSSLIAD